MEKRIYINGEETVYSIDENGKIYNKDKNIMLKGSFNRSGYHYYRLSKDGKKYAFYAHRLVAEYFLDFDPTNKKLIINHKDGNKTNNNVENLEICTYSENVKHAHETGLIGNRNEKEEELNLENEIWLDIKDYDKYKISNFGRLKSFNNGKEKILKNSIVNSYCQVTLSKNGKTKSCCVHKLVYSTFNNDYDLDGYVIDHIDNNPLNNNIDNLQKITNKENIEKELKRVKHTARY